MLAISSMAGSDYSQSDVQDCNGTKVHHHVCMRWEILPCITYEMDERHKGSEKSGENSRPQTARQPSDHDRWQEEHRKQVYAEECSKNLAHQKTRKYRRHRQRIRFPCLVAGDLFQRRCKPGD